MSESEAAALLEGLNDAQRQAATALRGPVAIHAGAGAGKTRTIAHRIAYGVRIGEYAAEHVLALSFTRKAARELQARLRELGVVGVQSQTFHSAASRQLHHFWDSAIGGARPSPVRNKVELLGQVADAHSLQLSTEALRELAAEIEWRKTHLIDVDDYLRRLEQRPHIPGLTADQRGDLMHAYEQVKTQRALIDFEDQLALTAGMITAEPWVAAEVRHQYRHFTVDEYQDVSPLQVALLQAWLGQRDDLCVVGDAAQTIYGFTGARSSYLLQFAQQYPFATVVRLDVNYRSTPEIVSHANRLVRDEPGSLRLESMRPAGNEAPIALWFADSAAERAGVAAAIRAQLDAGVAPQDIAVLSRTVQELDLLRSALTQQGILTSSPERGGYFAQSEVLSALNALQEQVNTGDTRPAVPVVTDLVRDRGWTPQAPRDLPSRNRWAQMQALLDYAREHETWSPAMLLQDLLDRKRAAHDLTTRSVTLATIHTAKGLEWPVVYLTGAAEGSLPISHATTEAAIAEERRVAYVALTRARDVLRVSGAPGERRRQSAPSRFLQEAGIPVVSVTE